MRPVEKKRIETGRIQYLVAMGTLLAVLLSGCGERPGVESAPGETVTPTSTPAAEIPSPAPSPSPEPAPDPGADPKGYVMDALEQCLHDDVWAVRFWIMPGTGPVPVTMPQAEYGESLRALFSGLDWELAEEPRYEENPEEDSAPLPGAYGIQIFYDSTAPAIHCHSNDRRLWVDTAQERLYFRAEGAEELCDAIADLWPTPAAELGRVRIPPQETQEDTARAYLEEVCARLEANGHITGHEIRYLTVEPPDDSEGTEYDSEASGFTFRTILALKPADPSLECWQDGVEEGTDWNTWWGPLRVAIGLSGEDGRYCLSFYDGGWPD